VLAARSRDFKGFGAPSIAPNTAGGSPTPEAKAIAPSSAIGAMVEARSSSQLDFEKLI
jgi:hypothetical protein